MADYVSNCPVSRPVDLTPHFFPHVDLNGIMWNNDIGFMFAPEDDFLPIRPPANRR